MKNKIQNIVIQKKIQNSRVALNTLETHGIEMETKKNNLTTVYSYTKSRIPTVRGILLRTLKKKKNLLVDVTRR